MNEPEAITGALYGNPRSNSVNKIVIFVWYSWFYARCLKMLILCQPTTMPEMSGRTHQTCNLHLIAICKWVPITKPDIPLSFKGHSWKNQYGTLQPLWFKGDVLPTGLLMFLNRLDQMSVFIKKVVWMLICFLSRIVIHINHIDESYHFKLDTCFTDK